MAVVQIERGSRVGVRERRTDGGERLSFEPDAGRAAGEGALRQGTRVSNRPEPAPGGGTGQRIEQAPPRTVEGACRKLVQLEVPERFG